MYNKPDKYINKIFTYMKISMCLLQKEQQNFTRQIKKF